LSELNLDEMIKEYSESIRGGHNVYVPFIERFLKDCKGDFSRSAVDKHIRRLRDKKYADGTIDLVFRTIRRFYKVNGLEWPFRAGEGPTVREREVYAPALDPKVVAKMIKVVKEKAPKKPEATFLALSTTYGLRRTEMASIDASNIDLENKVIFIETAKHGRQRYHLIPDEIIPYIKYDFPRISVSRLTKIYYNIEKMTGLPRMREVGWHSIRRILDKLLYDAGLPGPLISDFLRWKRGGSDMSRRYYSATIVGEEGNMVEVGPGDRSVDEKVFEVHPFLHLWGD